MLRRILWGPTLFVAVAVVAWSLSAGERAAHGAFLPTLIFSAILWFFLVARESHPGLLRGVVVGAVIGLVTQEVPMALDLVWGGATSVKTIVSVGAWSLFLGAITGWLAVMIQRTLDATSGDRG